MISQFFPDSDHPELAAPKIFNGPWGQRIFALLFGLFSEKLIHERIRRTSASLFSSYSLRRSPKKRLRSSRSWHYLSCFIKALRISVTAHPAKTLLPLDAQGGEGWENLRCRPAPTVVKVSPGVVRHVLWIPMLRSTRAKPRRTEHRQKKEYKKKKRSRVYFCSCRIFAGCPVERREITNLHGYFVARFDKIRLQHRQRLVPVRIRNSCQVSDSHDQHCLPTVRISSCCTANRTEYCCRSADIIW